MEMIIWYIVLLYTPTMEILNNGQTVGKMALGTRVLTLHGDTPDVVDYLIRWCFRLVEIYFSAGGLAGTLVMSGRQGQRLGGILSNTTVVKLSPRKRFTLKSLDEIARDKGLRDTLSWDKKCFRKGYADHQNRDHAL